MAVFNTLKPVVTVDKGLSMRHKNKVIWRLCCNLLHAFPN